jgi:lipopolysaccharide export system permease protein
MRIFGRYLFRQAAGALVMILISLTAVVWIATALKQLNVVTSQSQETWSFIKMTLLAIPNLMAIIAPVALLIAALHTLNRSNSDSELIVMTASGAPVWHFAKPLLLLAFIVSIGVLTVNLYVMPWSARTLGEMIIRMRTDLIGQVLQPGRFSSPEEALTIHIRSRDERTGHIYGLLMHDAREKTQPSTYLAERGEIHKQGAEAFLVMHDGHILRQTALDQPPQVIVFDQYVIDLIRFKPKAEATQVRQRELYIEELWRPDPKYLAQGKSTIGKLRAELHERLASALYPFAFVLVVIAGVGVAQTTRQNRTQALVTTFAAAAILRIGGFAAMNGLTINARLVPLIYAIPLIGIVGGGLVAWSRMSPKKQSARSQRREERLESMRQRLRRLGAIFVRRAAVRQA